MRLLTKTLLAAAVIAATPMMASAESVFSSNSPPVKLTDAAHVDFKIVVPNVLFLQVGTGSYPNTDATVDLITFSPTAAQLGDSTVVAGTGGDLTAGQVTVKVKSNFGGNVSLTATTLGALNDGALHTITFGEITTTETGASIGALALTDGGVGTTETLNATGGIVDLSDSWTYTYNNTTFPVAGTYGGVNTRNSRATYTAVQL